MAEKPGEIPNNSEVAGTSPDKDRTFIDGFQSRSGSLTSLPSPLCDLHHSLRLASCSVDSEGNDSICKPPSEVDLSMAMLTPPPPPSVLKVCESVCQCHSLSAVSVQTADRDGVQRRVTWLCEVTCPAKPLGLGGQHQQHPAAKIGPEPPLIGKSGIVVAGDGMAIICLCCGSSHEPAPDADGGKMCCPSDRTDGKN